MTVIVLLAMIALFVGLRLYAVLGQRTGHEQQPILNPADPTRGRAARDASRRLASAPADPAAWPIVPAAGPASARSSPPIPSFDVARFVEGAKAAYRMVLEAFWKGDRDAIGVAVDDQVAAAFATPSTQRETAGHTLDNRLVAIERAAIEDAGSTARSPRSRSASTPSSPR